MSINDKISVIIPVYNLQNYIKRTLDSVCAQTHSNIEIIVVDDGSNDKSFDIICNYAKIDSRIIPIHQENGGVTSARINGIKHATGEWIGFVDGDDLIDEDMYEFLINNAVKYNADISHCGYKMVLGAKRVDYYHNTGCLVEQDNLKGLCDLLEGTMVEPGLCNKLFHHTLFQNLLHTGVMNTEIKNYEDLLMNYYLFKESKKSVFEDVCKYHYMVRNNSAATSSFNPNKFNGPKLVFETIMADCNNDELYQIAFSRYIGFMVGQSIGRIPTEYKNEAKKTIKSNMKLILKLLNNKVKMMSILTVCFPHLYLLIRRMYEIITKIDQKYSV